MAASMADIVQTLKRRLLEMREGGTSFERQQRFIADAVICNKRDGCKIKRMAESVETGLVTQTKASRKPVASQPVRDTGQAKAKLDALSGTMAFWYYAVSMPAALRKAVLAPGDNATVLQLKREALLSGQVCDVLGISIAKLKALDENRLLPHRFTRRMDIKGRLVTVRCWLLHDVASFKDFQHVSANLKSG